MNENLYHYKAFITSVYDGDTVTATIDLGLFIKKEKVKIRLYGIDAPELRRETLEKGRESRDFLRSLVLNKEIVIQTIKDAKGKYGRYLAKLWIEKEGSTICINDYIVENGLAIYKQY
jgi:micrococcal nuclease